MKKLGLLIIMVAFLVPGYSFATAPTKSLSEITGSDKGDCGNRSTQSEANKKVTGDPAAAAVEAGKKGSSGETEHTDHK